MKKEENLNNNSENNKTENENDENNKNQLSYAKLWGMCEDKEFCAYITSLPCKLGRKMEDYNYLEDSNGCYIPLGTDKNFSRHHATIDWDYDENQYYITCMSKNGMIVQNLFYKKNEKAPLWSRVPVKLGPCCFYFLLPEMDKKINTVDVLPAPSTFLPTPLNDILLGTNHSSPITPLTLTPQTYFTSPTIRSELISPLQGNFQLNNNSYQSPPSQSKTSYRTNFMNSEKLTYAELVALAFDSQELRELSTTEGITSADIMDWVIDHYPDWGSPNRRKNLANGVQNILSRKYTKQTRTNESLQRGSRWKKNSESDDDSDSYSPKYRSERKRRKLNDNDNDNDNDDDDDDNDNNNNSNNNNDNSTNNENHTKSENESEYNNV